MRRRFFTILSALSLLLCAATCAIWVRSYIVRDYVSLSERTASTTAAGGEELYAYSLISMRGCVRFFRRKGVGPNYPQSAIDINYPHGLGQKWGWEHTDKPQPMIDSLSPSFSQRLGFDFDLPSQWENIGVVILPYWLLTILFAGIPAHWLFRKRRQFRRLKVGCCASCDYDLRATPDRCPECGTVPKNSN